MPYESPRRHLLQAMSLVEDILERRRREGQLLSDEEHAAIIRLSKIAPLQPHQKALTEVTSSSSSTTGATSNENKINRNDDNKNTSNQQAIVVPSLGRGGVLNESQQAESSSVTPTLTPRSAAHHAALYGDNAKGVFKNRIRKVLGAEHAAVMSDLLKASREDIQNLVNFSVACAAVTSPVKLTQMLVDNIKKFTPNGKPVSPMIFDGDYMVDPLSQTMIANNHRVSEMFNAAQQMSEESGVRRDMIYDASNSSYYTPIGAEGEIFGYIQISNCTGDEKEIPSESQQAIVASTCVAALALRTSWQLEDMEWSQRKQSMLLKIANTITNDAFASESEVIGRLASKAKELGDSQHAFFFRVDAEDSERMKLFYRGDLVRMPTDPDDIEKALQQYHETSMGFEHAAAAASANHQNSPAASPTLGSLGVSKSHGLLDRGAERGPENETFDGFSPEVLTEENQLAALAASQIVKSGQVLQLQQGPNEDDAFVEVSGTRSSRFNSVRGQQHLRHNNSGQSSPYSMGGAGGASGGSGRRPQVAGAAGASFSRSSAGGAAHRGFQLDLPQTLVKVQSIRSILGVPVLNDENRVIAVIVLANKNPRRVGRMDVPQLFEQRDSDIMHQLSSLTSIGLANCNNARKLQDEKKRRDAILNVISHLNECDIRNVDEVCKYVMHGAKKLLNADRSTLFLIDEEYDELYSAVADSVGKVIRFPVGKGIAGRVALTGNAESIRDAYQDDRFNKEVDKQTGYRTLSILTVPVQSKGNIVAVAQLINKLDRRLRPIAFSQEDMETLRTFVMFAGIAISNSRLLDFVVKAGREAVALTNFEQNNDAGASPLVRQGTISNMMAATTVTPIPNAEIQRVRDAYQKLLHLMKNGGASDDDDKDEKNSSRLRPEVFDPTSVDFDLFALRDQGEDGAESRDLASAAVVHLFLSTGFDKLFKFEDETLICFVLQCRKMYRFVPYHNFFHAVDATQTIYTFLYSGGGRQFITELETFVMLVTALVHDLDHMGTNNNYHLKTDSPLGILSAVSGNNSVLEVHHCNVAIQILGGPDCNIFANLIKSEAPAAYRKMMSCVLATDMARHGELLNQFEDIRNQDGGFDKNKDAHRLLAMQMLMKSADISNVTKPFVISRQWSVAVTEEFYQQGDKERAKGLAVLPMNDRQLGTELAKGQIGFINFVAMKFFSSMQGNLFKDMKFALDRLKANKEQWEAIMADEDK